MVSDSAVSGKREAMTLKRTGGVTAAAVVMFCESAFLLFLATNLALFARGQGPIGSQLEVLAAVIVPALWLVATGIGLLKLRPWAWASTIAISAVTIFVNLLLSVMMAELPLLTENLQADPSTIRTVRFGGTAVVIATTAIATWWLVFITRKRVRAEFSTSKQIVTQRAPAIEIPMSIRVIAIVTMVGAAFLLYTLQFLLRRHLPYIMFGTLATGWPVIAYGVSLALAQIVFPLFVLRRRAWAVDAMIAYGLVSTISVTLFFTLADRTKYFGVMQQSDPVGYANGVGPALSYASHIFSICVDILFLYFLLTRRKAFREACAKRAIYNRSLLTLFKRRF